MKLEHLAWLASALTLAAAVGAIIFYLTYNASSEIELDGVGYPSLEKPASGAVPAARDLSGNMCQLFKSKFSHLANVYFSVDASTLANLMRGVPLDVRCRLYELTSKPKIVMLRGPVKVSSVFEAAALCSREHFQRGIWQRAGSVVKDVLGPGETPPAYIVGQLFTATQNGLCGISVGFGGRQERAEGELIFHLIHQDNPNVDLVTQRVSLEALQNVHLYDFSFEQLPDSRFEAYGFYFTSPNCTPANAQTLLGTRANIEPNGNAWVNYKERVFDLAFKPRYCQAPSQNLNIPSNVTIAQLTDVDLADFSPVREGKPVYLGRKGEEHDGLFKFTPISASSDRTYLLVVSVNGTAVACSRFLTKHEMGTLYEMAHHVVSTLMIDKPPGIKKAHVVVLASLLLFLIVLFVNWLGLPDSCKGLSGRDGYAGDISLKAGPMSEEPPKGDGPITKREDYL